MIVFKFKNLEDAEELKRFTRVRKCIGVIKRGPLEYHVPKTLYNDLILYGEERNHAMLMPPIYPEVARSISESKTLHDYQKKDIMYSFGRRHVLNRNGMGLGKTAEAILWITGNKFRHVLIIAPKNLKQQWVDQFARWAPNYCMRPHILDLKKGERIKVPGIYIIHYEMLPRLLKEDPSMRSKVWDAIVADEAHKLKNIKTQRTQFFLQIPTLHSYLLTGTPIMNRANDLFSILRCLSPYYSGTSYWTFTEAFCHIQETPFGRKITGITQDPFYADILKKLLDIVAIHNPAVQLTPGKVYTEVNLDMLPEQQELYNKVQQEMLDTLYEEKPEAAYLNGLAQVLRMQQISSNPGMFDLDGGVNVKFDFLEVMDTDKIVVYSRFKSTILALADAMPRGVVAVYTGDQNDEERQEALKLFKESTRCKILAGTVQCMSEGIDGLQYITDTVVFLDKPDSPQIIKQAEDRVCRQGQQNVTQIISLNCSSIDRKVGKRNLNKLEDIKELLSES